LVIYEGHDGSFWHRRLRVYRWPGSSWTENHSHPTRSMMLSVAQELQEWPFCGCRRSGDFADLSFESDDASLGQFETWIAQDQLDALGSRFSRRHNLLGRVQVTMLVEQEEVAPGTQFVGARRRLLRLQLALLRKPVYPFFGFVLEGAHGAMANLDDELMFAAMNAFVQWYTSVTSAPASASVKSKRKGKANDSGLSVVPEHASSSRSVHPDGSRHTREGPGASASWHSRYRSRWHS